jgi:hypothetical protein
MLPRGHFVSSLGRTRRLIAIMAEVFLNTLLDPIPQTVPAAQETTHIQALSADLALILGEYELPLRLQTRISEEGYTQIYSFAMMAADRAGVLALAARSFLLNPALPDHAQDLVDRAEINSVRLLASWMAASARFEESNKLASRASDLPIVIPKAMLVALRKRFENLHSRVSDKIYPCAYMLEMRLEEVEEGTLTATPLEEVICAEQGADSYSSDALSVHGVRFRKAPKAIPVPTNGEELRARFKTLTVAFVIASFKQSSCPLAQDCHSRGLRGICGTPSQRTRGQLPTDREELSVKATWAQC